MIKLVITTALLSSVTGAFIPFNGEKIVQGRNTSIEEVPYQVAIENDGDQFCGGSIISTRHVLTAAHCFLGHHNGTEVSIRTGSTFRGTGGTVIKASKVVTHPNYNGIADYDVVVIELQEDIKLSETSQIIGLADSDPSEGTEALIAGWGRLELAGGPSDILQSVTIPIVNHQKCIEAYQDDEQPVTDRMICAGGGSTGGCKGDSGGGLVVTSKSGDRVVAGILSYILSHGCSRADVYQVYSDVANSEIRNFIRDQAGV